MIAAIDEIRPLDHWAEIIREDLSRSVEGIVTAGAHLQMAKAQHPGTFLIWLNNEGPGFGRNFAHRLMVIADRWSHVSHERHGFPAVVSTLHELTKLEPEVQVRALETGAIHADMTYADARKLVRQHRMSATPPANEDDKQTAIRRVLAGEQAKVVAQEYGFPRSSLSRWSRQAPTTPKLTKNQRKKLERWILQASITLDGLVSSLFVLETIPITTLEPVTWPWLDTISESITTLHRFNKELNRARANSSTTETSQPESQDRTEGAPALGADSPDASEPRSTADLPGESRPRVCGQLRLGGPGLPGSQPPQ